MAKYMIVVDAPKRMNGATGTAMIWERHTYLVAEESEAGAQSALRQALLRHLPFGYVIVSISRIEG